MELIFIGKSGHTSSGIDLMQKMLQLFLVFAESFNQ